MVKKRVHELARELGLENKELMQRLSAMGVNVKSTLSTLDDEVVARLQREAAAKNEKAAPAAAGGGQAPQSPGGEKKRAANRPPRGEGRKGGVAQYGPGLVDRVPSRPPDRRFLERPLKVDIQPPGKPAREAGARQQKPPGRQEAASGARAAAPPQGPAAAPAADAPKQAVPAAAPPAPAPAARKQAEAPASPPARAQNGQQPAAVGAAEQRAAGGAHQNRPPRAQDRPPARADRAENRNRPRERGGAPEGPRDAAGTRPAGGANRSARNGRPAAGRPAPGGQDRGGAGQGAKRTEQLKVPRLPQELKAISEKVRADKTRGKQDKQKSAGRPAGRDWRDNNEHVNERKLRPGQRKKGVQKQERHEAAPAPAEKKPIVIGETVTVQELAEKMKKSPAEVIKKLMMLGVLATINQEIDSETATIVAGEFGFEVEVKIHLDAEALLEQEPEEDPALLQPRPCVVTVMGHVDHGKTSLLDAIRETNVTATEAGGITQHIGAYQVEHNNKKITFVDTPGHEAFTAMRARGAQVTDIVILVVAADDGVMPQTVEAINHARAAGVPIIVAINKMDKPGANPDRVKQQLTEYGLVAEDWGGDTILVPVSAKTRQGLEDLLEMVLLVAEMSDLKANPNRPGKGAVLEAELDKGRGPVATVLVQNGTLNIGDNVVAGTAWGRVRAMMDYKGRRIKKAGPSTPVEVLGFCEVPQAGDLFYVVPDEKTARQIAEKRANRRREEEFRAAQPRISLDDLFKQIKEGQVKELPVVIKADVQGSVEALKQSLERLSNEEVKVNIIHGGVGAITETDIMLASASNAIIIGFNVRPDINARRVAESEKVDIRMYRVIYDAIEDVRAALSGLLEPEYREVVLGRAEVRKTFKVSRIGTIAGCYVVDGKLQRDAGVRVIRDGVVIHEGRLDSLKRFKDDVREVVQGYECGLTLDKFNEIREGDFIEAFTTEAVKRELA